MEATKAAARVLASYKGLKKLANKPQSNFQTRGLELIQEIDAIVYGLPEPSQTIIRLWFCEYGKKQTQRTVAKRLGLSLAEYEKAMTDGLLEFAQRYRGGVLMGE